MKQLTIADKTADGVLSFDLRDIIRCLGAPAMESYWEIGQVECLGAGADAFYKQARQAARLSGRSLLRLADHVDQVIDGEFRGYRNVADREPWVIVRAVDSSAYDIESDDDAALNMLRRRFKEVADI